MDETSQEYKRNQVFIKKRFQFNIIFKFCLLLLAGVVLSTGLLFIFSQDTLTSSYAGAGLEIKNTGTAILPMVVLTNLITLGIICCSTIAVMLFISHKIAGPLFRFEKDIKRVSTGDLSVKINLRKKDQLKDMAKALNLMIESLYTRVNYVDTTLEKIETLNKDGKDIEPELLELRSKIRESFILER